MDLTKEQETNFIELAEMLSQWTGKNFRFNKGAHGINGFYCFKIQDEDYMYRHVHMSHPFISVYRKKVDAAGIHHSDHVKIKEEYIPEWEKYTGKQHCEKRIFLCNCGAMRIEEKLVDEPSEYKCEECQWEEDQIENG